MPAILSTPAAVPEKDLKDQHAAVFDRLSKLPPFHPAAAKLLSISSESQGAISEFEKVFKSDPALTADLLLVANSAAFGFRCRVETIKHALTLLGLERVRSLGFTIALSVYVRNAPRKQDVRNAWAHSIATAVIAEALGKVYDYPGIYTAGLMHDVGRLGLLLSAGDKYAEALCKDFSDIDEANKLEKVLFGVDHCEAGALVARTWGFPDSLQACMANHHAPAAGGWKSADGLVCLACRMADWLGFPEIQRRNLQTAPEIPPQVQQNPDLEPERLRQLVQTQLAATAA